MYNKEWDKFKCQRATWVWRKRGRGSYDTLCVIALLALVRALPMPPPDAKPLLVACKHYRSAYIKERANKDFEKSSFCQEKM